MKPFQLPAPRPEAVDVPIAVLDAEMKRLALQKAYEHQPEPLETEFARLACEHPEACSCSDDYPNWTPGGTS
ncbi:hypothetical protein ABZW44_22790 [Streptomyces mirabilis]|uniref:hypothetical protein n=1 Tax=Streptomyces mirabilis TaxID=68239 RepID=UPI0033A474B5